jgi:pimeloyl-ACP methyl ester carboxylesterase
MKFTKKVIKITVIGVLLSAVVLGLISYGIVKRFTSRRSRDVAWYIKTNLYKQVLCQKYSGEEIKFSSKDGLSLAGLLFIRQKAQYNLLVCHGYSRHKEDVRRLVELFPDENIMFFDYRAHGASEGVSTTIGAHEILDVLAAHFVLQTHEKTKSLPIVGIGFSMGGATLLGAAVQGAQFKGLVIDSVFKRLDEQITKMFTHKTGLPAMPFAQLCQSMYAYLYDWQMSDVNPYEWIQKLQMPMLIIHAKNDTLADATIADELFAVKSGQKKLWIVDEAPHATIFKHYPLEYTAHINAFLSSLSEQSLTV